MASLTQVNQFPCRTLSQMTPHHQLTTKPSMLPLNSVKNSQKVTKKSLFSIQEFTRSRSVFLTRAVDDDKRENDASGVYSASLAVAEEEKPKELMEIDNLKKALVDSFYGTDRGLSATSETRAEIIELITQLEANNPTAAPTEALTLLNGKWILVYTSFSSLFPLLSRGTLPLARVEEISQTIDSENLTVQNSIRFAGPFSTTSFTTNAKFEVRSPKRVQIKFEEGVIGTPQVTDSIVLPENVEFLGQKIDLTPFKGILTSVQETASSVAKTISSQPPLEFPISNSNAQSWLLTTYLDEDLRISWGDAGAIFVLIKEGSPLCSHQGRKPPFDAVNMPTNLHPSFCFYYIT